MNTGLNAAAGANIRRCIVRPLSEQEKLEQDAQIVRARLIYDRQVLRAGPRVLSEPLTLVQRATAKSL